MVQPSIESFRRANKRFQFSLLCRLLTRECLTIVKHEQRARFLKSQAILYQKKVEKESSYDKDSIASKVKLST